MADADRSANVIIATDGETIPGITDICAIVVVGATAATLTTEEGLVIYNTGTVSARVSDQVEIRCDKTLTVSITGGGTMYLYQRIE